MLQRRETTVQTRAGLHLVQYEPVFSTRSHPVLRLLSPECASRQLPLLGPSEVAAG